MDASDSVTSPSALEMWNLIHYWPPKNGSHAGSSIWLKQCRIRSENRDGYSNWTVSILRQGKHGKATTTARLFLKFTMIRIFKHAILHWFHDQGCLVAPTLSIGSVLLQQAAIQASFHYNNVEIVESRPNPSVRSTPDKLTLCIHYDMHA